MKRSKLLASVLVVMLLVSLSGVSAFADEELPTAGDQTPVIEQAEPTEPADSTEPADPIESSELEVGYLRFDLGEDLIFIVEDGVIVEVTTELNFNEAPAEDPAAPAEDPAAPAEDPAAPAEDPAATAEDPAAPVDDPADPFVAYLGLPVAEGVELLLAGTEVEYPIALDIFANGDTAVELKALINDVYTDELVLRAIALDSDNPHADRFINAAIYRITPGKMNLLEKLAAQSDEEIDYAELATWDVKDIQGLANAKRTETKSEAKSGATNRVKSNNGKAKGKSK
ncbi:hypothetical protein SANA_15060 [Gottschalkiaceae bacterium SANA]|nr:hypothetical protein SANA_15060 [Gottschalkiaceae bacterium SANA]